MGLVGVVVMLRKALRMAGDFVLPARVLRETGLGGGR
jgi:hypothetical protein